MLSKLLFFLRLWAQVNGIFGFDSSTKPTALKSYGFSLLFIAYLQDLKLVHELKVYGRRLINDWVVDYEHQHPDIDIDNKVIGNLISVSFQNRVWECLKLLSGIFHFLESEIERRPGHLYQGGQTLFLG